MTGLSYSISSPVSAPRGSHHKAVGPCLPSYYNFAIAKWTQNTIMTRYQNIPSESNNWSFVNEKRILFWWSNLWYTIMLLQFIFLVKRDMVFLVGGALSDWWKVGIIITIAFLATHSHRVAAVAAAATVCILHVTLRHGTNVRRKLLYTNNDWVYRCREPHDWSYSKFQRGYSDINRNQGFTRLWPAFFFSRVRRVTFRRGTAINKIHLESLQTTQLRIMQS